MLKLVFVLFFELISFLLDSWRVKNDKLENVNLTENRIGICHEFHKKDVSVHNNFLYGFLFSNILGLLQNYKKNIKLYHCSLY